MIRYKEYGIEANECGGWVLSQRKIYGSESKFVGEEYFVTICYPTTLKRCFEKILELEFAKKINEKDYTIKEALQELKNINDELSNAFYNNIYEEIE